MEMTHTLTHPCLGVHPNTEVCPLQFVKHRLRVAGQCPHKETLAVALGVQVRGAPDELFRECPDKGGQIW